MGALWLLVRHSLRPTWRGVLATAVIVAVAGGVGLMALAGARRTASAFPRYLEASHASDVGVQSGPTADDVEYSIEDAVAIAGRARSIDGVVDDASYIGLEGMYPLIDGEPGRGEVIGSLDGRFIDLDRVAVVAGRLPRPEQVGEVFLNETAASLAGLRVGDHLTLQARAGYGEGDPFEAAVIGEEDVVVVGTGLFPDEVLSDDFDQLPRILTSPALTTRYLADVGSYLWQGLRLAPGTDVDRVIADYGDLAGPDFRVIVRRTDEQIDAVQRSGHPVVTGVAVFAAAALVAALALGILAGLRLTAGQAADATTLRAIGLSPRRAAIALASPVILTSCLGGLGAALLAAALSPLAPFGAVRSIEPHRGVDIDLTVLALGGLLLAGALSVAAWAGAWSARRIPRRTATSTRVARTLTAAGASPAGVVGVQHALGATGQATGVPARSAVVACAASVVAIVAALVFGAGVRALVGDPARYGWNSDLAVEFGGGYAPVAVDGLASVAVDDGVAAVAVASFAPLTIGDRTVSAMGLTTHSGPPPVTVLEGSLPQRPDEVALGSTTARHLGLAPGDDVVAGGGPRLRVTGLVALPAIGQVTADHPSLGEGAVLILEGLSQRVPSAYPTAVLVDLDDPDSVADRARVIALIAAAMSGGLPPEAAEAYADLRPGEISGLMPAVATTSALAGALGLAAVVALGVTLSGSVRRQRRAYAILRALGFDSRQVRAAVHWQVNATIAVALVVGVPFGLVVGRLAWRAFAENLGTVATPVVPTGLVALAAAALVVVANGVGEIPARRATRTSAQALRDA